MSGTAPSLVFRAAGTRFALPAPGVAEAVRQAPVARVPGAPDWLVGLANVRGEIVTVVEAAPGAERSGRADLLVLADRRLALAIDGVESLGEDVSGAEPFDLEALRRRTVAARSAVRREGSFTAKARDAEESAAQGAYLEVRVAGQAYALPLRSVVAVAALDGGRLVHRGADLPVARLSDRLGLESAVSGAGLVLATEDGRIGLAVDGVRDVLRPAPAEVVSAPAALNRAVAGPRIERLIRAAGRLVAVLDPEAVAAGLRGAAIEAAPAHAERTSIDVLAFDVAGVAYAAPLSSVEEVCALGPVTRAPRAPPRVLGLVNRRGVVAPVLKVGTAAPGGRAVVVRHGAERLVLPVDAVSGVVSCDALPASPGGEGLWGAASSALTSAGPVLMVDPALLGAAARDRAAAQPA